MNFSEKEKVLLKECNKKLYLNNEALKNIVFIYCPPKVGSTTLVSSIRLSATPKFKVIHIHDEIMLHVLTGISGISINKIIEYNKSLGRNIWVIDVYRTPIERKMSEFFDKLSSFHFNNSEANLLGYDIRRLITRFNNIFEHLANGDHYKEKYNISTPSNYPFQQKYLTQKQNEITYVKLRLCDSMYWETILSDILKTKITIVNDYETDKSTLAELYKRFKKEYKVPVNYLEKISQCPYINYYYSEEEKEKYLTKWRESSTDVYLGYNENEYKVYLNICIENQWKKNIQTNHYLDEGCFCKSCSKKRQNMIINIRNGKPPSTKIIHVEEKKNINMKLNKKIPNVMRNSNLHQRIKNNLMSGIIENK
jgi:hypothetical protein